MRVMQVFLTSALVLCLLAGAASATEVRIFKPGEEGVSPMELRSRAMAEGFAQAVLDESVRMLPAALGEARAELLRLYMIDNSKPYVQGYKIVSSEAMNAGLILNLDVFIDKKVLRDSLRRMGLFATTQAPQPATLNLPAGLAGDETAALQGLITLTGLSQESTGEPALTLEKNDKGVYSGRLQYGGHRWVAMGKDLASVWFDLWARFFTRAEVVDARNNLHVLSVSGWFSPDAALEFDRVLREWDSAVQEVQLVELDMQPTGVGANWEVRVVNGERLDVLLRGFLPQRGLSYQMTRTVN
jgi:hypothetical protein